MRLGFTLLLALLAVVAALAASGLAPAIATTPETPVPTGSTAGMLGGALGVLLAALFLARSASGLLGPYLDIGVRPVDPLTRSFGRALPAMTLLVVLLLPATVLLTSLGGAGAPPLGELLPFIVGAASLIGLVVLALEKYSSWSGAAASRIEPQLVAAMLAALPALLLGAFGMGDWTLITQFLLLGLVAIIPV